MEATDVDAFFDRLVEMPPRQAWSLLQRVQRQTRATRTVVLAALDVKRHAHAMAAEAGLSAGAVLGQARDAAVLVAQPRLLEELRAGRRSEQQAQQMAEALVGVERGLADQMARYVLEEVGPEQPPRVHRELTRALVDQEDEDAARGRRAARFATRTVTTEALDDDMARLVYTDRADLVDATFAAIRRRAQKAGDPRAREGSWAGALADAFFETVTGSCARPDVWAAAAAAGHLRVPPRVPSAATAPPPGQRVGAGVAAVAAPLFAADGGRVPEQSAPRTLPGPHLIRPEHHPRPARRPVPGERSALVLICETVGAAAGASPNSTDTVRPGTPADGPENGGPENDASSTRAARLSRPPTGLVVPDTGPITLIVSSDGHGDLDRVGGELLGVGRISRVSRDLVHAYLDRLTTRVRYIRVDDHGRLAEPAPCSDPGEGDPNPELAAHIRLRDRTCRWEGCWIPATRCDLDHLVARRQNGKTTCGCLWCLCNIHHQGGKHLAGCVATGDTDGTVTVTDAVGHQFLSRPAVIDPAARYLGR